MNTFHLFGVVVLVHVTVITSVAVLLVWCGRRRSAFQHTVGIIGLLLTLSSPILVLALPQANWFDSRRTSNAKFERGMSNSTVNVPTVGGAEPDLPSVQALAAREGIKSSGPHTNTTQGRSPSTLTLHGQTILAVSMNGLFAVWFLGSVVTAHRLGKSRRTLQCLSRSWTTISPVRLKRIEHAVAAALKMDKLPPIRVVELAPIPLVLGVLKPVVVLPQEFAETASDERLRDVLIHEYAHIVRRDP